MRSKQRTDNALSLRSYLYFPPKLLFLFLFFLSTSVYSEAESNCIAFRFASPEAKRLRQIEVRSFIVYNYRSLSLDISSRGGEYINSLCYLLNGQCKHESKTLSEVQNIFAESASVGEFARNISEKASCLNNLD